MRFRVKGHPSVGKLSSRICPKPTISNRGTLQSIDHKVHPALTEGLVATTEERSEWRT